MPTNAHPDFYSAVFFDMDGLLVDSEPLWLISETQMMAQYGYEWLESDQAACLGGPLDRVGNYMSGLIGGKRDGHSLMTEIIDRMVEKFKGDLPFMPGAIALITDLRAHGIPLTLVSASPRSLVDAALSNFEVNPFVRSISSNDVKVSKPDPEGYLLAATSGGHEISNSLVLEDSLTGVTAAKASGAWVLAVPHLVPIEKTGRVDVTSSLTDWSYEKLALKYAQDRSL
jgi:HAD superfamily hydrolase (TIGR01509 family)|uniref:HAD family hydrolase n=2 Tax=Candidatus Planktophila sp. TaxID=2175601 RepID=UPI0040498885